MTGAATGPATEGLRLDEAVDLGYAVAARAAADAGVRLLAIKGPVLAQQGLRSPAPSVDIDVLVEPAGYDRLRARLEEVGWHDGGVYDTPGIVPIHSVNHRHASWPCEMDVHHWFPGFLADPAEVFDVLWERRTTAELARVELTAPDPVAHAALAALHYLRDSATTWGQTKAEDLATRIAAWDQERLEDLGRLAADTGASGSLEPFLRRVGAPVVAPTRRLAISPDDWQMRADAQTRDVLPWLVEMGRLPWYRRPGFVVRALWMTDRHFQHTQARDKATSGSRRAVLAARWHRLRRGWRALPAAWADYRRLSGRDRDAS